MQLLWRCGHPSSSIYGFFADVRFLLFISLLQKPDSFSVRPWESCQAGSLLRCRFFFSVPQPSSTRAETIWNDLRCKAKVFVLLPAWRSNAIWANAACVGHPQNLEALRASGADVKAGAKGHQKSNAFCSKKKEVWICYVSRYVKAYIKQVLRASCNCQAKRLHEEGSVHAAWCTTNFLDTSATHDSSTQLCNLRSWLKVEGRWNECCDFVCSKRFDFFPMQIHKMETEHCFEGGS